MGAGGFVVLPLIAVLLYAASKKLYSFSPMAHYLLVAYTILYIDLVRKDNKFLHRLGTLGSLLLLLEYGLLALLLLLPNLKQVAQAPWSILPIGLMAVLAALLPPATVKNPLGQGIKKATTLLPLWPYEWRLGIRRNFFSFAIPYILGLVVVPFLAVTPFLLLYYISLFYEFYKESPPKEFIQSGQTAQGFVNGAIRTSLFYTTAVFLPHYLLYVIFYFHYAQIGILLLAIILVYINLAYMVALKYTTPINKVPKLLLFFVSSPIVPVSAVLLYTEVKKAKCQVSHLLP